MKILSYLIVAPLAVLIGLALTPFVVGYIVVTGNDPFAYMQ